MWLDKIVANEAQAHLTFFGKKFDLSEFEATLIRLGKEQIEAWSRLLLEPHYWPEVKMDRKAKFPGWKVRPNNHSYEVVCQGKIFRQIDGKLQVDKKAHWLLRQTFLIDTRLKPNYKGGKQMYRDDYLGPIMTKLRQDAKISQYQYGSQASRFGVSADEWEDRTKSALTNDNRFNGVNQWRLERAIEANVIPQMYLHMPRKDNGETNTRQWYEEYFEGRSSRVSGGYSDSGGLADFYWDWSGDRWDYQSFCPLAVL